MAAALWPWLSREKMEVKSSRGQSFLKVFMSLKLLGRKGLKRRGWPESTNTWEPYKNLVTCGDAVEAFEQRIQSRKNKPSRKPKGNSGASTSQSKKVDFVQEGSFICGDDGVNNDVGTNMEEINIPEATEHTNESVVLPSQVEVGQEQNERNVNQNEITNEVTVGNFGVDMQGWGATEVDGRTNEADCVTSYSMPDDSARVTGSSVRAGKQCQKNPVDNSDNHDDFSIIKIVKPLSFEASDTDDGVLVNFTALRSDEKKVTVDNRFLKFNNPLMLINYYESHLKYIANMEARR